MVKIIYYTLFYDMITGEKIEIGGVKIHFSTDAMVNYVLIT